MKLKILKNIHVDMEWTRLQEIWPKFYPKHSVIYVDKIEEVNENATNLVLDDGNVLLNVPKEFYCNM